MVLQKTVFANDLPGFLEESLAAKNLGLKMLISKYLETTILHVFDMQHLEHCSCGECMVTVDMMIAPDEVGISIGASSVPSFVQYRIFGVSKVSIYFKSI